MKLARPAFERFRRDPNSVRNGSADDFLKDFLRRGSAVVGSPAQVQDKLLELHAAFGNELFGVAFETSPRRRRHHPPPP